MIEIAAVAQAVAVLAACWAIISGIGAWKREFLGKRQIELAEQALGKFFEIKDAIAYIRNPFGRTDEGKSRQRGESELPEESDLLDRGYVVVERYAKKEAAFAEFNTLKYRFMAAFGPETEAIFADTSKTVNSIFVSAQMLVTHYWKRQGRVSMEPEALKKHLQEMHSHERVFWYMGAERDDIGPQLQRIQERLEAVTAPCFQEPMSLYSVLTRPLPGSAKPGRR